MDIETEIKRLQSIEREYEEYLRAQCESVGASTDVEGLENPKLALACRYALANKQVELRDFFAAHALSMIVINDVSQRPDNFRAHYSTGAYAWADAMLQARKQLNCVVTPARAFMEHGINCHKVQHESATGFLHSYDDDTPYNVDGVKYCGRCHEAI